MAEKVTPANVTPENEQTLSAAEGSGQLGKGGGSQPGGSQSGGSRSGGKDKSGGELRPTEGTASGRIRGADSESESRSARPVTRVFGGSRGRLGEDEDEDVMASMLGVRRGGADSSHETSRISVEVPVLTAEGSPGNKGDADADAGRAADLILGSILEEANNNDGSESESDSD